MPRRSRDFGRQRRSTGGGQLNLPVMEQEVAATAAPKRDRRRALPATGRSDAKAHLRIEYGFTVRGSHDRDAHVEPAESGRIRIGPDRH